MANGDQDDHSEPRWDVFLSYSSEDRVAVSRIQRFVETYKRPDGRNLKVYRDATDIRGGNLPAELREALRHSSCLVVCCSPNAADSEWVDHEIRIFREVAADRPVIPILLAGDGEGVMPARLRGSGERYCDLRSGWRFGSPREATRVELLRLIAGVSDSDFRELLPLDKLRRRRNRRVAAVAGVAIIVGTMSWPVVDWDDVTPLNTDVFGCDSDDTSIRVFAMNPPGSIRNVVAALTSDNARGPEWSATPFEPGNRVRSRLLPWTAGNSSPCRASEGWVGQPAAGLCVSARESELLLDFADPYGGGEAPATDVQVGDAPPITIDHYWTRIDYRLWDDYGTRLTPSAGLPVSVLGNDTWLGFRRVDSFPGGLWHSDDLGATWTGISGFSDVFSVRHVLDDLMVAGRRHGNLGFYRYHGGDFVPYEVPGKGDDIEVCGSIGAQPLLRIDRQVYLRTRRPWVLNVLG